jgi:HD superfamily phosphodiesterase
MASSKLDYSSTIESRFPGLIEKIRNLIWESEKKYEGASGFSESFLWEHTTHAASLSFKLAQAEGLDPLIPAIAALFHDAGKFAGGRYHTEGTVEEEESARIASRLLREAGMKASDIRRVISGLKALYREKARKNVLAAILHDADLLSKFGALGVANFFTKSALRGRTIRSAVLGYLSKELTYAACLSSSMHTSAGRKLAAKKAFDSLKFFRLLLCELREARIADLRIKRIRIAHPVYKNRSLEVHLVLSAKCPECSHAWSMAWLIEKGVKCTSLNVDLVCSGCGQRIEMSFCLPEIAFK